MFFFVILQSNKVEPLLNTKVDTCRTNNHSKNMAEHNTTRMRQLIETLNKASEAYYNGQGELMTDYEWDAAFDELKALEDITGIVLPDSPTAKVSEDDMSGQKEEHEFAALSLAKTKQPQDLAKWAEGREIWLSWKLDGLTLVVTYDNGRLSLDWLLPSMVYCLP